MSYYPGTPIVARRGYSGTGGLKSAASSVWGAITGHYQQKGQLQATQAELEAQRAASASSGPPAWLLPAAVAGVAVVFLVTRKKK